MSFVLLVLLAGLALACASGCKPQDNVPEIVAPENPDAEGEGEAEIPIRPPRPTADTGDISIIIPRLFVENTKAVEEKTVSEGLTPAEMNQAYTEIAGQTGEVWVGWRSNTVAYTERPAVRSADLSYKLTIPSLKPEDYTITVYTESTMGIVGWRKDQVPAKVEAGKTTSVAVSLERAVVLTCVGQLNGLTGTYSTDADGKWVLATVRANTTDGLTHLGYGLTMPDGSKRFWVDIPMSAIVGTITVTDDNGAQQELAVDTADTYAEEGWSVFDRVDGKELVANTEIPAEDTGGIDVLIEPINPVEPIDYDPADFTLRVNNDIPQAEVGEAFFITITWPYEAGQWLDVDAYFPGFLGFPGEGPINHPTPTRDEQGRWHWGWHGRYQAEGEKSIVVEFYDSSHVSLLMRLEKSITVTPTTLAAPTIEFSCPTAPGGRIPVSVSIPMANDLREFLVNPYIGQIAYVGVAGPNGNWIWDPATSPYNSDVVAITIADPDVIGLTTGFEPWADNHFRGTLFAVDVDGNVSFFDLARWTVKYGTNQSVVVDDGLGGIIIDFLADSGGC